MNYEKILNEEGKKHYANFDPVLFRENNPAAYRIVMRCMKRLEDRLSVNETPTPCPPGEIPPRVKPEKKADNQYRGALGDKDPTVHIHRSLIHLLSNEYNRYIERYGITNFSFNDYLKANDLL